MEIGEVARDHAIDPTLPNQSRESFIEFFAQRRDIRIRIGEHPLKRFENERIVGINWDLVKTK